MNDKIKGILEDLSLFDETNISPYEIIGKDCELLLEYITKLQEENERLKDLYERTCKHLFNIGKNELARYFQAQIHECNVFVPQDLRGDDNEFDKSN